MPVDPSARRSGSAKSSSPITPITPIRSGRGISLGIAFATWVAGWLAGNVLGSAVAAPYADTPSAERPVWVTAATAFALWTPQLIALVVVSRRFGLGRPFDDFAVTIKPIDLVGIPIGVLSQLVVLRLVYWPLQSIWPATFANKRLEENARDLYDRATGGWLLLLIVVVVLGAPFVEELVYRGLLQGAARRRINDIAAVVAVAVFFALIHFRPVEYPGLFAFGIVVGACALATGRIGMSILTHVAFNATGLALVAS